MMYTAASTTRRKAHTGPNERGSMEHLSTLRDRIGEALEECENAEETAGSHLEMLRLRACAESLKTAGTLLDAAYDAAHTESKRRLRLKKYYTAMIKRRREQADGDP